MTGVSPQQHNRVSPRRALAAISLAAALFLAACGEPPAPVDEWEVTWRNTVTTVEEAGTPDITQRECEDILAYLRVQRTVLSPIPLDDLETPVDAWFTEAESVFFACDLAGDGSEESLETLRALEGEVDTVLELEG